MIMFHLRNNILKLLSLSFITLNRLVLVLGKLSRRLAAFMVAALAPLPPSGEAYLSAALW